MSEDLVGGGDHPCPGLSDDRLNALLGRRRLAKARGVEHTITKPDGTIGEKNSYGNDPNPPKG